MLFGTKEEYSYFECSSCGTLQIVDIPEDLSRHYPETYLGELGETRSAPVDERTRRLRRFLRHQRVDHMLGQRNPVGWVVAKAGHDYFPYNWDWFRTARVTRSTKILDVGCGRGDLLNSLRVHGFTNAVGQDVFQRSFLPGVVVMTKPLEELEGEYGLVMAHHSFEHMPDPIGAIANLKRLCAPDGTILLRTPVAGCLAWREYGANWYQIDAPRHLVIPSEQGLRRLAQRAQMKLARVEYDSDETQFGCSEQYAIGIALKDARSYFAHRDTTIFTEDQKRTFRERARRANAQGEGDQACFYLTHWRST
jgi:2-polyprenyl-3-methyl-5-hydroxy-6-metoxy-1,4-benzoquinol methylase